jgi:hypothetical protein
LIQFVPKREVIVATPATAFDASSPPFSFRSSGWMKARSWSKRERLPRRETVWRCVAIQSKRARPLKASFARA